MKKKALVSAGSLAVLIGLWLLASIRSPSMFPPPGEVFSLMIEVAMAEDYNGRTGLFHLRVTFTRILIITVIAFVISIVVGVLMGTRPAIEEPLSSILPVWLTVPSIVVVLFSMVQFNFTTVSVLVAVTFVTTPFGIVNTYQGTKSVDSNLLEMASVFEFSQPKVWKNIYIPSLFPYLFASSRYLLGMIWKIVLLAETFGITTGVGSMIRFWYSQGDLTTMLSYFMMFAITVLAIEYLLLAPAERRLFAYRSSH
jgi:NitT/TauT family transport system permease protein